MQDLVRDSGIYGLAFHHYLFGYPVMDKPLLAMLKDGQPDLLFLLAWANEPWTVRWDGEAYGDGTLLAQDYGNSTDWRRHSKYIRSGGNVQLILYSPDKTGGTGKRMSTMWRR